MRRPVRDSLCAFAFLALTAAPLPAAANDFLPLLPAPPPAAESCRVPQLEDPSAVVPRANLAPAWAKLAAEGPRAQAEGVRPLNTRGHNYDTGRGGLDPAALGFEARGY